MSTKQTRTRLQKLVNEQKRWIRTHGATLRGYIANYPNRTPERAQQAYNEDFAKLKQLRRQLDNCR